MSEHQATIRWRHSTGEFANGTYTREHTWTFDGGVTVPASSAPTSVRPPFSNPANVDPEEAFVAAIASCHMLSFLWVASREKIGVVAYEDDAVGTMTKNERGVPWVSSALLRPRVTWAGARPSREVEARLHHLAHEECYVANSVKTDIRVEPVDATATNA